MESDCSHPLSDLIRCCDCNCSSSVMKRSFSGMYLRSVKRKYGAFEEENQLSVPGLEVPQIARVEIGNECMALRQTVSSQQQTIQNLIFELEEERNASSSAANEAMSMILRLQRDKAEIQMEAKQFKRFAEEKMAHDQMETLVLEDLLCKREEVIHALQCEVQDYKQRMMSYGLTDAEIDEFLGMNLNSRMIDNSEADFPYGMYPPIKCYSNESHVYDNGGDETPHIDRYAFREISCVGGHLKNLDVQISRMGSSQTIIQPDNAFIGVNSVLEKVIVGQSPKSPTHIRKFSTDNPNLLSDSTKENSDLKKVGSTTEAEDDLGDRICAIDSVYQGASTSAIVDAKASVCVGGDKYMRTPGESPNHSDGKDLEIQKLYARLHALEAGRESMRQAIISIGTEKAQMVLFKEIAQKFSKEMSPARRMHKMVVGIFSFMSIFKWIIPHIFWRRKVHSCKYMFGLSSNTGGLLLLLDGGPHMREWKGIHTRQKHRAKMIFSAFKNEVLRTI